jgi:excisionase family DNA binding protein
MQQLEAKPKRYLSTRQLCERYGVHEITIHRWVQQGKLPRPIKTPGGRRNGYAEDEIEANERARAFAG